MKNITKALILALSLVLLLGSVIGISVAAEEATDSTAAILAQSIVHKDKIQIAFAVDATADEVKAGDVTVEYYLDGDTEDKKTATLYTDGTYNGNPVLVTQGFAAQDLTSVVTATSYLNGVAKDTKTYSVAQFLLVKLYKDVDSVDAKYVALYESLIDYSAKAQAVFDPEEISINDHFIVWTEDAKYDSETVILCNSATTLDLSKAVAGTVENYTFKDKWNVIVDGVVAPYANDATVEVSANTAIKPVMEIAAGTGKYFNDTSYHSGNVVLDFQKTSDMDVIYYDYKDGTSMAAERVEISENEFVLSSVGTGNWQGFQIKSPDATTQYSSGTYVFEADLTINSTKSFSTYICFLGFVEAGLTAVNNENMFEMGSINSNATGDTFNIFGPTGTSKIFPTLNKGVRYNVRVEHDVATGVSRCYVNGELIHTYTGDTKKAENSTGVITDYGNENSRLGDFMVLGRRASDYTFDNIFYGVINGVVAE